MTSLRRSVFARRYLFLLGIISSGAVANSGGCLHFAADNPPGGFMAVDETKRGAPPASATGTPSTAGGGASHPERSAPAPGAPETHPIGTPLTPEQLRRLKEEAERPGRKPPGTKETNQDSSETNQDSSRK